MAILSISEAAREAGVARTTIQRALKEGRLSATRQSDGTKGIDTSELYRVFGEPRSRPQRQPEPAASAAFDALQQQLDAMRQELDAARSREEWYQQQLEREQEERRGLEQRLLSPPEKRGWFRWWRR